METFTAILIAVVVVLAAIVAWRASLIDDSAGDNDYAGLKAAVNASQTAALSPLLRDPYYVSGGSQEPQVSRYEADVYLVQVTELLENYVAATAVKEAWDYKANN